MKTLKLVLAVIGLGLLFVGLFAFFVNKDGLEKTIAVFAAAFAIAAIIIVCTKWIVEYQYGK